MNKKQRQDALKKRLQKYLAATGTKLLCKITAPDTDDSIVWLGLTDIRGDRWTTARVVFSIHEHVNENLFKVRLRDAELDIDLAWEDASTPFAASRR